tara:strand:+ start:265 stop:381 length:117 start_codon:yes stop_codon:yes gene_type:complete
MALIGPSMTKKTVGWFEINLSRNADEPSMPYYGEFIGE